jgi:hypothetical protein
MVLHRPVELGAFIGNLPATGYSRALREADSECYF